MKKSELKFELECLNNRNTRLNEYLEIKRLLA